jgi:hypothetical protein
MARGLFAGDLSFSDETMIAAGRADQPVTI